ncbi:MAG: hypothetical protein J7K96_10435 [Desulfobacteraceae bacterium]|nr:hypothetical protein [Desulfobacteraceae bacterium]
MNDDINEIDPQDQHVKRLEKLATERKHVLSLDGMQALDAILDHPQPNALIHSFAEEDLHFLIHHIGPEDALDIIAMASDRQWEFILDIETWEKDRINLNAVTEWLGLMLKAAPERFIHWIATEQTSLLEYLLFHSIEMIVREHDQDPSDFEDGFITYDDVFYFRIPETKYAEDADTDFKEQHQELLNRMIDHLAKIDHVFYQKTLLRAANVISAESEEEAFRLRNFRLAEKGFVPFHEAVGVFQPISVDHLKKRKKIVARLPEPESFVPVPVNQASMMDEDSLFSQALCKITDFNILQQLQTEFAGVCNQLIATEPNPVRTRDELKTIVKKACGFISISLENLLAKKDTAADVMTDEYIMTYPLIDLFRNGYGEIANLRQEAKTWQKNSWCAKSNLPLSFWGERFVGVIGGLLINRPKFYDIQQTGNLYREFETMADAEMTGNTLRQAMTYDNLLSAMAIRTDNFSKNRFITCENLLMTLWARHCLELSPEMSPIPVSVFRPFFTDLWESGKKPPAIKDSKKTEFLQWLASESGLLENKISHDLGNALELLFNDIAKDYGTIQLDDLDPRFVTIFLLGSD